MISSSNKENNLRLHGLKIKIYELLSLWMLCKIKRKLNYAKAYLLRFSKCRINTNALCVMAIHFTMKKSLLFVWNVKIPRIRLSVSK